MQDMINSECSVDALRRGFACLLVRCTPTNGRSIFEMFLPELCGVESPLFDDIECTLWALESYANELGRSLQDLGWVLPALRMVVQSDHDTVDVHEHNRDVAFNCFSAEQLSIAAEVLAAEASGQGGIFYVQASGGCGKSFWAHGVGAALGAMGRKPVMVAASALEGYSVQSEARHNVDGRGLRTVPFCYSLGWGLAGSSRKRASDAAVLLQFQFVGENGRFLRKLVPVLRVR